MPDASPSKWHLAHTSWFFENVILEPLADGYRCFHPDYGYLFNSYYESFGPRHERPNRGLLTRPPLAEVLRYRQAVDAAMERQLEGADDESLRLTEIGLQHEQQHQELLLTDILHAFSCNPLAPAYAEQAPVPAALPTTLDWLPIPEGLATIGHRDDGFAYDNEGPAHTVYLAGGTIASRPVNNAEFLAFIEDGGYAQPELWLSDGWDWRCREALDCPLYWRRDEAGWQGFSLRGRQPLEPAAPVAHLSYYEADAYARWAGARLPTEAEWETVAAAGPDGHGWFGAVWQWTASPYMPYPGYRPPAGALGEYNAKFMCNQLVLRGSSALTPPGHARTSYRNFFYPESRWQCTGLRLARDPDA